MQPQTNAFQPRILAGAFRSLRASPACGCRCGLAQRAQGDGCSTVRTGHGSAAAAAAEPGSSQLPSSAFLLEELAADFAGACRCRKRRLRWLAGDDGWQPTRAAPCPSRAGKACGLKAASGSAAGSCPNSWRTRGHGSEQAVAQRAAAGAHGTGARHRGARALGCRAEPRHPAKGWQPGGMPRAGFPAPGGWSFASHAPLPSADKGPIYPD